MAQHYAGLFFGVNAMAKKKVTRKRKQNPPTVKFPTDEWKDSFRATTFRTNFSLYLSQPMIEFICAVADGVHWDRTTHSVNIHRPDNWIATAAALMKRGLISRKSRDEINAELDGRVTGDWDWTNYHLTPAGDALVQLFRVTGVFVEADAAITKRFKSS